MYTEESAQQEKERGDRRLSEESWKNTDRQSEEWLEEEQWEAERQEDERRERERQERRRQRIEQMKIEKRRREMLYRYGVPVAAVAAVLCVILLIVGITSSARQRSHSESGQKENAGGISAQGDVSDSAGHLQMSPAIIQEAVSAVLQQTQSEILSGKVIQEDMATAIGLVLSNTPRTVFEAHATEQTNGFSNTILSTHGIMIDVESGEILAQKNGWSRINPASMTKILTVLVAAEHITDMEDTFTMTIDITDYSYRNDCSSVGFEVGEEIPLKDLFYGTVLPSGADAALGLAVYVAGSQEAFVELMNEKLEELGLSETTHFTNCIGLYDENHYSTPYDMAVILKEATDNEFCRQVLSEHHYVTSSTPEHPNGIDISNWFLRRIEDRDTHGEVLCGKTGYVVQSKNCAASLGVDHGGREYICVTAGSNSVWTCIRDHVELYQRYLPE